MKAKHLLILMLALLTAMMLLVSCGGDADVETNPNVDTDNEVVDTQPKEETDASGAHVHTPVEKIEEPTCESRGYKREVCATCDE